MTFTAPAGPSGLLPSPAEPAGFEGGLDALRERQLVFQLVRDLARAQFRHGDRVTSERLWQEAAAEGMDPERITALLYGVDDHGDTEAMEAVDRLWRREHPPVATGWQRPAWLGGRRGRPACRPGGGR